MKILHFADAHIDIVTHGRHDPATNLPVRAMDFLKSLDAIVDTAITEAVDLVLFAGDAYKSRTPAPTYQREWGRRIMLLSKAGIPTLLLTGNHDVSPAFGRAHALEPFSTFEAPSVRVIDRPCLLGPAELGLPAQVIGVPWISRSGMIAHLGLQETDPQKVYEALESRVTELVLEWLDQADSALPTILLAHAAVQGSRLGSERSITLGREMVLPASLVKDRRFSYVALGHVHQAQDLNEGAQPPAIYSGSIERVDWGEAGDEKRFVVAEIDPGQASISWRKLDTRACIDAAIRITSANGVTGQCLQALPDKPQLKDAVVRLTVDLPAEWRERIDQSALHAHASEAFSFQLNVHARTAPRLRLPEDRQAESLSPLELLALYWEASGVPASEFEPLQALAAEIIRAPAEPEQLLDPPAVEMPAPLDVTEEAG
jgi:exonuclease SbcD